MICYYEWRYTYTYTSKFFNVLQFFFSIFKIDTTPISKGCLTPSQEVPMAKYKVVYVNLLGYPKFFTSIG